jgi:hypothetical protein
MVRAALEPYHSARTSTPGSLFPPDVPTISPIPPPTENAMSLTAASRRTGALAVAEAVGRKPADPAPAASARSERDGAAAGPLAYRLALHVAGAAPPSPGAEPPLEIGAVDDPQEREAEAAADRVMRTPEGSARGFSPAATPGAAGGAGGEGVRSFLASSAGEPLPAGARSFMEPRFGRGFGDVRVHTGPAAAESARSIGAAAYAVGPDLVFGEGRFRPDTQPGRRLLAHELAHVAQQSRGARRRVQRVSIYAYNDTLPQHDPSQLSDATVQATDEYRSFLAHPLDPPPAATPEEALLGVRLLLRWIRDGNSTIPFTGEWEAQEFLTRARRQLGALGGAEGLVGHLSWAPVDSKTTVAGDPEAMHSEFTRWVLAGGERPKAMSGKMNCWEMVLYGAHPTFITFPRIQEIYTRAVAAYNNGTVKSVGDAVETELRGPNAEHIFTPGDLDSPEPLPGDMVIFNRAANHAAISTGIVTSTADHEVISLWTQPDNVATVQRTTIEALLPIVGDSRPVRFWSAQW